jgi:hypothetical protein
MAEKSAPTGSGNPYTRGREDSEWPFHEPPLDATRRAPRVKTRGAVKTRGGPEKRVEFLAHMDEYERPFRERK